MAGPLADRVFEPMMLARGRLAGTAGRVLGTGTGRGIGLQFVLIGFLLITAALAGLSYSRLRSVERELPDCLPEPATALGA
jgi:hypothetical protein